VEIVQAEFDRVDENIDPYAMRLSWEPTEGASAYIVEIFPVKKAFGADEDKVVQVMTQETTYNFHKPDLCEVYMGRIMAVTGSGMSSPRYRRLNGFTQSLDSLDLHIAPASMARSTQDPYPVKATFQYRMPETFKPGDLEIADSNVRAFDCNEEIDKDSGFADTNPDSDGFYWPLVFVNVTESEIQLSFPAGVMYPKCKFLFKVLAMNTRCGFKSTLDEEDKRNEVPFAMNCATVQNANCAPEKPSRVSEDTLKVMVEPREPTMDGRNGDHLRPMVFGKAADPEDRPEDESSGPPSPWNAKISPNDTLWVFFENFLRGFNDGAENETKSRKRVMPDEPVDPFDEEVTEVTTPLPPAPIAPQNVETSSEDDKAFEKAFVESIDDQPDTSRAPEATSVEPSSDPDTIAITENPGFRGIQGAPIDGYPLWFSPIQYASASQVVAFVCLLGVVIFLVVFVLWFTATRRPRRKEQEVQYYTP
jgi:hypothetical protein